MNKEITNKRAAIKDFKAAMQQDEQRYADSHRKQMPLIGQFIIYENLPYQVVEVDEEDNAIKIWSGEEDEDGYWINWPEPKIVSKVIAIKIVVNEKAIKEKYPNYQLNWDTPEQFIDSIINDIQHAADIDMSKDGMRRFGYSIEVIS